MIPPKAAKPIKPNFQSRKEKIKIMKKILSLFLVICTFMTILTAFSVNAADSGMCGENLTWTLDDKGTLTISGTGAMKADGSWNQNARIKEIFIADGVTNINQFAFAGCKNLTNVTIPNSITSIGNSAFADCIRLKSITIPNGVNIDIYDSIYIGSYAFGGCTGLMNLTIPANVYIDHGAFENCTGLETVTISDNVYVGVLAFENCTNLKNIAISDNVSIAERAFSNTAYYNDNSNWENGTLYIDNYLIEVKSQQTGEYVVREGTKSIASSAFTDCIGLTSIAIPNSVTDIGSYAFGDCTGLTNVIIPDNLKRIQEGVFNGCTSLTSVTIPDSIKDINSYAFKNCTNLKSIVMPDYVYMGNGVFKGCVSLTNVTIPSCPEIKESTFEGCTGLTNIIIPMYVRKIESKAFSGCTALASIAIPNTVNSIGDGAFFECNNLNEVFYSGTDSDWKFNVYIANNNEALKNAQRNAIYYIEFIDGEANEKYITYLPQEKIKLSDIKKVFKHEGTVSVFIDEDKTEKYNFDTPISGNLTLYVTLGEKIPIEEKTPQNITVSEITEKTYGDADFKVEVTKDAVSNLDTFTYESSNSSVAEISTDGTVTIKGTGETDITVKQAGDDTYAPFEKTQKLVVKKVPIAVTAEAKSKKIGAADPELTFTYTGALIGSDEFTGKLERQAGEEVGQYDILIGTLAINDNYDITYNKAIFEIFDKTPQNITVADFGEKTYGDNSFKVEVTKDPVSNLDTFTYESSNPNVAEISADGTVTIKGAGEANITVKEPGNDEYAPFKKSVKLVVKKKAVTVTSVDIENKTAVLDGVLAEDAENVLLDFDKITIEQGEAADETTVNVTLKGFSLKGDKAANYEATTESLASVMANDKIVSVEITAENGTVTGAAKYIKGSSVTVTATANSGYKFKGWYADNTMVSNESTYTFTADTNISLIAKFEKEYTGGTGKSSSSTGSCTIKLDTNGGNSLKNISVKKGQKIGTIETPKKDGYVFDGWYSDKALTKPYNSDETVTASKTLYASWKIDPARQLTLTIGDKNATVFGEKKANDVAPIIRNDRTMLPARFVAENLGAKVEWDEEKQLVTITGKSLDGKEITILITIGSKTAKVNDKETELDSEAFIENDRTYTPVRFIAESLGASVEWNESAQEVIITK